MCRFESDRGYQKKFLQYGDVAQLVDALLRESRCCRFESCHPHQVSRIVWSIAPVSKTGDASPRGFESYLTCQHKQYRRRLMVRTEAFQASDGSSILLGDTNKHYRMLTAGNRHHPFKVTSHDWGSSPPCDAKHNMGMLSTGLSSRGCNPPASNKTV
jgi:hypothetical protein